ncbi:hypothetical protein [Ralstonia solanacearum]|uniref:hypothetical protein n=1 Tax=Ralstonia solanacearum TaxID=305 RepID=UPI000E591D96|nr:hypothetical protein [Ralstonia solanacearum]AXW22528.1 hypothetical protein CJO86_02410 [Ralstonia solanacearum]
MEYFKHKPEPTQPGNPYRLTKNQHVFPDASIARFENAETGITAILLGGNKRIANLRADNRLFCANRVWDQRAESGYMASIEGEFQFVARSLIMGDQRWLSLKRRAITRFYALWEQRAHYAENPVAPAKFNRVQANEGMTKDFKERLESMYTLYIDEDSTLPSRQATGMHIQFAIDRREESLWGVTWSLCRATSDAGEFIVPDRPVGLHIPLTPTLALLGNSDIDVARPTVMRAINLHALAGSRRYVFAHDLTRCFVTGGGEVARPPLALRARLNLYPDEGVAFIGQ